MEENTGYSGYTQYTFKRLAKIIGPDMDIPSLKAVYKLKTFKESGDTQDKLKKYIINQRHFRLAMLRNDRPFSFHRLDSEGIVESLEVFYTLYLLISDSNVYRYCLIKTDMFAPDVPSYQLILIQKVDPFPHKLYYFWSQVLTIYHRSPAVSKIVQALMRLYRD